ncbi:MAG: Glycine--tRNA ligase beta subunit [Planctomycetes bacterium]|nr:Glycine--tRNA ligase beta subunit [Planctomycetota bacterium]
MTDLLFELLCEELPAKDVRRAALALEKALGDAFAAASLPPASTSCAWTPRRIAVWAHGLPARSPDREDRVKGPRVSAAFDASGALTKAAEGFARKNGVDPATLVRDGDFVVAVVRASGRSAADAAAEILPKLFAQVPWRKTMKWGAPQPFARPVRGVVALLGADVVPCTVNGLAAGRTTKGHPFLAAASFDLAGSDRRAYVDALRARFVMADPAERESAVREAVVNAAPGADLSDPELVEEVTNLVEWPSALDGRFDAKYLELPPRLLTTVMAHHQRFFPVRRADGSLAPGFVAVLDRDKESVEPSRRGFERVLVPRLHDAVFFFGEDRKRPLADRLERLKTVTYHKKLGSTFDKAERLARIAGDVAKRLGADAAPAARAGLLAKCDLVTLLVGEFPELQGHVGSVYARLDGEDPRVAEALDWQYRHDFEGAAAPGPVALAVILAERLDIVCEFGVKVGLPTGSADPFGVRRAAISLLDACERWARDFDLRAAAESCGADGAVLAYLDTRLRQRFRDRGFPADLVDAVPSARSVGEFSHRADVLRALASDPEFDRILEVAERCRNITAKNPGAAADVRPDLLAEPAERDLWNAWSSLRASLPAGLLSSADALRIANGLAAPLHRFFADVFVNAEDPAVRANRLAVLTQIDGAFTRLGDLSKVARRK